VKNKEVWLSLYTLSYLSICIAARSRPLDGRTSVMPAGMAPDPYYDAFRNRFLGVGKNRGVLKDIFYH
jgi:hypothetical protein